jgi:hypothetical protein
MKLAQVALHPQSFHQSRDGMKSLALRERLYAGLDEVLAIRLNDDRGRFLREFADVVEICFG